MKLFTQLFFTILFIFNSLLAFSQFKNKAKIRTHDNNTYIGIIISEDENFVKMIIGGRDTIQIQQLNILHQIEDKEKRNHIISLELSNYYFVGLNYDFNFYRKNNLLIGGTVGAGDNLYSLRTGVYAGFRQPWQDILKVEVGMGLSEIYRDFSGPYVELAYRSQRDNRWFYWEVNSGFLVNIFEKWNTVFGLPYGGIAVGVNF